MSSFPIDPSLYGEDNVSPPTINGYVAAERTSQDAQVNELLKKKRKAREHKACYPCRQRKVKCDLSRPCQTCRDRDHPELCLYSPPNKRQAAESPEPDASNSSVVLGRTEFDLLLKKLDGLKAQIAELRKGPSLQQHALPIDQHARTIANATAPPRAVSAVINGASTSAPATTKRGHADMYGLYSTDEEGYIEHFGAGSIPAMLHALKKPKDDNAQTQLQEQLNNSIIPLFGLDEEAPYPFIDLWGLPQTTGTRLYELAKVIPDDTQTLYLWRNYKSTAHVIFPGIADIQNFERDLTDFLVTRATQVGVAESVTERSLYGKNYHWLGLFFAVLASGAQCTAMPRKQRLLTSQVYGCCTLECMKIVNFLNRPSLETIQSMLVLQSVLADNMSAGTAWCFAGLTVRLAHALGLHSPCTPDTSLAMSYTRSSIWWATVWQDSLLSVVYDRASSQVVTVSASMPMPMRFGDVSAYHKAMYKLAKITLDVVQLREQSSALTDEVLKGRIIADWAKVQAISDIAPHLQDFRRCQTEQESIEYWYLRLHTSYCLADLCRPAVDPKRSIPDYRIRCIDSLIDTIDAFLGMSSVTAQARRSWPAMHRALSAALLLGILGQLDGKNRKAIATTASFMNAVRDITDSLDPQEIAGPIKRGIMVLHQLRIPGAEFPRELINDGHFPAMNAPGPHTASTLLSPPQLNAPGEEVSPYSTMNTILWGSLGQGDTYADGSMPW